MVESLREHENDTGDRDGNVVARRDKELSCDCVLPNKQQHVSLVGIDLLRELTHELGNSGP